MEWVMLIYIICLRMRISQSAFFSVSAAFLVSFFLVSFAFPCFPEPAASASFFVSFLGEILLFLFGRSETHFCVLNKGVVFKT